MKKMDFASQNVRESIHELHELHEEEKIKEKRKQKKNLRV